MTLPLTIGGTATRGTDYRLVCDVAKPAGSFTCNGFDGNSPSITFHGNLLRGERRPVILRIEVIEDNTAEPAETVTLRLGSGPVRKLTLKDAPSSVTLSFFRGGYSVFEALEQWQPVLVADAAPGRDIAVPLLFTDITTTKGEDYTPKTTVTFEANGGTRGTFGITILEDMECEGDETFRVAIDASRLPPGVTVGGTSETVVTIENDCSTISFDSETYSVTEGEEVSVTVTIDPPRRDVTEVSLVYRDADQGSGGTARRRNTDYDKELGIALGKDYDPSPESVSIPYNAASHTFTVRTLDEPEVARVRPLRNVVVEPDETFTVSIVPIGAPGVSTGSNPTATVTIRDNDGDLALDTTAPRVTSIVRDLPSVSPTALDTLTWRVNFSEDVRNVDAGDFTLTGTTATLAVRKVTADTYNVTASGGDLAGLDGTVTLSFATGQNIQDMSGNALVNTSPTRTNDNTFVVINTSTTSVTPVTPVVTISAGTSPVTEGTAASFTVTATPAPPSPGLTVAVTASQTGEFADSVFLSSLGATGVILQTGEASYTFTIPTDDDSVDETDGSVTVTVNAGSGYTVGSAATATVTVNDNDENDTTPPRVTSITRQTPSSSPTAADSLTWRVTFNEAVQNVDAADFQVSGTTAVLTVDRVGATNAYDVTASGGNLANLDDTVTLSFASGQDIEDTSGNRLSVTTPTAANDNNFVVSNTSPPPQLPAVSVSAVTSPVTEGTAASFTVSRSGATTSALTVLLTVAENSAGGRDFVAADDEGDHTVTIPVGSATATYSVPTVGDTTDEPNGRVTLSLRSSGSYGQGSPSSASVTVNDDDSSVDTAPMVTSIRRQSPSSRQTAADTLTWRVTFNEAVRNVDGTDFQVSGTNATLTVAQVGATNAYDVTASGGDLANLDATVTLSFASSDIEDTSGNALTDTTPTGTNDNTFVVDNTSPPPPQLPVVTVSAGTSPVTEGAAASFTVSRTGSMASPLTVLLTVAENSADGQDFVAAGSEGDQTVTIPIGSATATHSVPTVGDTTDEPDGRVMVSLRNSGNYSQGSPSSASVTVNDDDDSVDTTAPMVTSITRQSPSSSSTAEDTLTWRVTFNEAVQNVDGTDFQVSGTNATLTVAQVAGTNAYDVTASGGDLANLDRTVVTLFFASGQNIQDMSGNALAATTPTGANHNIFVVDNSGDDDGGGDGGGDGGDGDGDDPLAPVVRFSATAYTGGEGQGSRTVNLLLSAQPPFSTATRVAYQVGGSATPGEDFTALSGTVSMSGSTATIPVSILDDQTVEDDETIVLTLAAANGYTVGSQGRATVTITDDDEEARATDADTDAVEGMEAWRLRFGRTFSQQVADALQDRFAAPPTTGLNLTVAGEAVSSPPALMENDRVLSKALGFENVSPQLLAEGSSFSFAPQGEGGVPQLALWGQGAFSSFSGQEDELSLDGDVTTLLVGADWSTARWQAGAALSRSWGNGSYDGNNDADGEISTSLTGLFPYGRYALSPRLGLWATAGYGWGDLSLKPDDTEEEYEPDTTMTMVALGMDGLLLDGGNEGVSLNATADLLSLNTSSEEVEGLKSSEGNLSRLRLGLEATRPFPLANGSSLLPSMEVGIRQDGGDAETGFGMDLGAGIAWKDPQRGISGELRGRTILTHTEEEFQDQGLALSFSWDPSPSNRGPYLSMGHAMGATATADMDALLHPATFEQMDGDTSSGQQFEAELAYGFPVHNDRLTLTPAVAMAFTPTSRNYGLLWSLAPYTEQLETDPWQFSIEAERQEQNTATSPVEHSLKLRFSLPYR